MAEMYRLRCLLCGLREEEIADSWEAQNWSPLVAFQHHVVDDHMDLEQVSLDNPYGIHQRTIRHEMPGGAFEWELPGVGRWLRAEPVPSEPSETQG